MSRLLKVLASWIPLAIAATAVCGLVYVVVQQALRQGANDPQVQMAEDAAAALNRGASLEAIIPKERVELSRSLAPFVVAYDSTGKPLAGSGALDGNLPGYPMGALEASEHGGENRVTWQPRPGVRIASVVVPYDGGYVMAGRSLREVENREDQAALITGAAWLLTMFATLAATGVTHPR
jgi:hypothetical protein